MAAILIVGDAVTTASWAMAVSGDGHEVDLCESAADFPARLATYTPDLLIGLIRNANRDDGMLIAQARAAWPACRILAVTPDNAYRRSAVYRMGLWSPDRQMLLSKVGLALTAVVRQLLAAPARPHRTRLEEPREDHTQVVVLPRRWSEQGWFADRA